MNLEIIKPIDTLLIRMDRIGDLVLTLPVDECDLLKGQKTHWIINQGMGFLPEHAAPQRFFTEIDVKWNFSRLRQTMKLIKKLAPKKAIVFYAPWWIGLALWLCRIPIRIGRLSQWHSFFFFNFGIRQSRSEAIYHEYVYNLRLIQRGFLRAQLTKSIPDSSFEEDHNFLKLKPKSLDLDLERFKLKDKKYIVIHPGMRSSALNWPCSHYIQLIKKLLENYKVVITGTMGDRKYLSPIQIALDEHKNLVYLNEKLNTSELISILTYSQAVLAPSTGVIHIAASCGASCVGIYSPIKVEGPTRWAPRGPQVKTLVPIEESTDENSKNHNEEIGVMSSLSVEEVYQALMKAINETNSIK